MIVADFRYNKKIQITQRNYIQKTIITITKKGSLPQTPLPLYKTLATTGATNKRTPLEKQQEFHIAH